MVGADIEIRANRINVAAGSIVSIKVSVPNFIRAALNKAESVRPRAVLIVALKQVNHVFARTLDAKTRAYVETIDAITRSAITGHGEGGPGSNIWAPTLVDFCARRGICREGYHRDVIVDAKTGHARRAIPKTLVIGVDSDCGCGDDGAVRIAAGAWVGRVKARSRVGVVEYHPYISTRLRNVHNMPLSVRIHAMPSRNDLPRAHQGA